MYGKRTLPHLTKNDQIFFPPNLKRGIIEWLGNQEEKRKKDLFFLPSLKGQHATGMSRELQVGGRISEQESFYKVYN